MSKRPETLTLKPSQFKAALRDVVEAGCAPFVWGPPGIGKSQISKQVADELAFNNFQDIRLSQMEPTDLRGIPMPTKDDSGRDVVRWSSPDFFDLDTASGDRKAFYLFDEMNSAPPSIQAAAYQIVLDKRIGPHKMGPKDFVMAAGNRETDKGATFKMATPLMNRFVHLELTPDFEDFQTHALSAMFHQHVVGYLTFAKNDMFQFDPTSASRGFPTPRSWEMVSKLLNAGPKGGDQILTANIAGAVGEGIAVKFMAYRKRAETLPNPTDILRGKVKEVKGADVSLMYSLITSLCYELKGAYDDIKGSNDPREAQKDFDNMVDTFFGFLMDNEHSPELTIMGVRTALAVHKIAINQSNMKNNWERFISRYEDLIIEA